MIIRKTIMADWDVVLSVYAYAREQMRKNGNPSQWGENRPHENSIRQDIENGNHYIIEEDGQIVGVFAFVVEYMLGLKLVNGGETYEITPCMMGVRELEARIPVNKGWLYVKVKDGEVINNEIKI